MSVRRKRTGSGRGDFSLSTIPETPAARRQRGVDSTANRQLQTGPGQNSFASHDTWRAASTRAVDGRKKTAAGRTGSVEGRLQLKPPIDDEFSGTSSGAPEPDRGDVVRS